MIEYLIKESCLRFGIEESVLKDKSNTTREVAGLRYALFYILRLYEGWTLACIGRYFSKSHGTVIYGINKTNELLSVKDTPTVRKVAFLESIIKKASN